MDLGIHYEDICRDDPNYERLSREANRKLEEKSGRGETDSHPARSSSSADQAASG